MTLTQQPPQDAPFLSLYIHWPFCASKCPYCDFNSHVREGIQEEEYLKAYIQELNRYHALVPHHILKTIFFGGGTPSLMNPRTAEKIITHAKHLWSYADPLEISMEANPSTAEINRFKDFRHAGVNRLSIGVQSFHDQSLQFLGRMHGAKEAIHAVNLAKQVFDRVSFDLIYALPHQTLKAWENELEYALSFGTDHLSLYQLTIEPGTAFAPRYERGEIVLPHEELAADLFLFTDEKTAQHGFSRYEVSNHAKKGFESQHNLTYWNYGHYIGIGAGAHGRFVNAQGVRLSTQQYKAPELWLKHVLENKTGDHRHEIITPDNEVKEALLLGLRKKEGLIFNDYPFSFEEYLGKDRLQSLLDEKYIEFSDDFLKLTSQGLLRLNGILNFLMNRA